MRVLDTATILAAMAQVSPRPPRRAKAMVTAPAAPMPARSSTAHGRSCHRPATPVARDDDDGADRGGGTRTLPRSALVVVPQGVIPVIVMSTRLAAAARTGARAAS